MQRSARATPIASRKSGWSASTPLAAGAKRRRSTSPMAASSTRSTSPASEPSMTASALAPRMPVWRQRSVLPGFGLTLGFTLAYLGLIVLIPLGALFVQTAGIGWQALWAELTSARTLAAFRISFGLSALAALANAVFGLLVAWVLVRYTFPGRRIVDALIDLPFALPTAVAGIALTALYRDSGWIGRFLEPLGIKVAFTPLGVVVALTFIGLPFVVRTVQPILEDAERELEEAAASLGATSLQTFVRIV